MIRHTDDPATLPSPAPAVQGPTGAAGKSALHSSAPILAAAVEPTPEQLKQAVAQANSQMKAVAPSLQFEIDPDTHSVVIRLIDREDQRVLRQVPSTEMLAIARALARMHTLLLRTHA